MVLQIYTVGDFGFLSFEVAGIWGFRVWGFQSFRALRSYGFTAVWLSSFVAVGP